MKNKYNIFFLYNIYLLLFLIIKKNYLINFIFININFVLIIYNYINYNKKIF